jgi:hypothetical protein
MNTLTLDAATNLSHFNNFVLLNTVYKSIHNHEITVDVLAILQQ